MKKITVVLLALVLFAASAFAEEILWADTEAMLDGSGRTGEFITLEEAGVRLWLPDELSMMEIDDDYREMFYVAMMADKDGTMILGVQYLQNPFSSYAAGIRSSYKGFSEMAVNGINVIRFPVEILDLMIYAYEMPDEHTLICTWEQVSRDDVKEISALVAASVQFP